MNIWNKLQNIWNNLQMNKRAAQDITGIVVNVVLVIALIPIIVTFIAEAENLTATEQTLLGLTTLFIVLGLVFSVIKGSKLSSGK